MRKEKKATALLKILCYSKGYEGKTMNYKRLSAIMPQLSGLSGILHLETWTPDTTDIVFDRADL